jgi:cytidine deaminase
MMPDWGSLLEQARSVQQRAYAPYSEFRVGAALLGVDGKIYAGCNVENASYRVTTCAEQGAIATAVAAGARRFTHLALVTDSEYAESPCGACRQVLSEFAPELEILSVGTSGEEKRWKLNELLPMAFTPKSLQLEQPE